MWMPTHVQVTVQRATGLLTKGKNHTNDCFVTIALGKTKYQTSVKEKSPTNVEWHEECELPIPDQGNKADIILTTLHRNFMGVDEFLGRVVIPLNELDVYERPKNKWYTLQSKAGHENKAKDRGKLEVKIGFTVKSGSLSDITKKEKHKSSMGQLSHVAQSVGGSLLSLGSGEKRKGIKKFAKSIGSKMHLRSKKDSDLDESSSVGSVSSLQRRNLSLNNFKSRQTREDADPGVVSEDEDEFAFDELSHKSSASSLSQNLNTLSNLNDSSIHSDTSPPVKPARVEQKQHDEWETKLLGKNKNVLKPNTTESLNRRSWEASKLDTQIEEEPLELNYNSKEVVRTPEKEERSKEDQLGMFSKLMHLRKGGENTSPVILTSNSKLSSELLLKYQDKSREDLILMTVNLQNEVDSQKKKLKDLEDYIDDLLLRVMETTPKILQNPYVDCKVEFSQKY
ncbi:rab11 family-interacting protein 2 isoform X2 [Coccinella septempunctata]|uniref:rab11 family-interacting protein 2 isoform X2 n=1 Tax=Coccinella septempunctata TaxID=41139 RepID=UPI001D06BC2A|nr:rab11 family-interacting protein 2 isoform X2 [Coccinella septempunctata]